MPHDDDTATGVTRRTTMTDANCHDSSGPCRVLSEHDLDAVVGGAKAAPPPSKPSSGKLFEVEDYSFDIEQVLN
jgi:hypothetical protein